MDPFKGFETLFRTPFEIPDAEWAHFTSLLKIRTLEKGQSYFLPGESFHEIGFVARGLLYTYYLDEAGTEVIKNFSWEGKLASSYASLLQNKPAPFGAKAVETSTLITLPYEQLLLLYKRHICWERMGRRHAEQLFVERERREVEFLMLDTLGRYKAFCQHFSPVIERVPQYMIASYLGVTPVALSRVLSKNPL